MLVESGTKIMDLKYMVYLLRLNGGVRKWFDLLHQYDSVHQRFCWRRTAPRSWTKFKHLQQ